MFKIRQRDKNFNIISNNQKLKTFFKKDIKLKRWASSNIEVHVLYLTPKYEHYIKV